MVATPTTVPEDDYRLPVKDFWMRRRAALESGGRGDGIEINLEQGIQGKLISTRKNGSRSTLNFCCWINITATKLLPPPIAC